MDDLRAWAAIWGDLASVAGLGLAAIGFAVTIYNVRRTKAAAESAQIAALSAKQSIAQYDAVGDLAAAVATMDEIKRFQRQNLWSGLTDRYSDLRRRLVTLKASSAGIPESHRQTLQEAIETFADLERIVDRAVARGQSPPNPPKLNDIVSSQIDRVHMVLLELKQTMRS